jgi:hypothetical protein
MVSDAELDRWNGIIHALQGTCNSLESYLENNDAEDLVDYRPFLEYLDQHIFLCGQCDWWCELSEMSDEEACSDCSSEEYE